MDTIQILSKALLELSRVEQTAGLNDAAYRKQCRIILSSPGVQHALARARDAPAEPAPKPVRKCTAEPVDGDTSGIRFSLTLSQGRPFESLPIHNNHPPAKPGVFHRRAKPWNPRLRLLRR